tara:strand:- start:1710 stop:1991 length:282 start_codon:yes stop_codon:yes gene_type:complete
MKNLNSKKSRNTVAILINEITVADLMIENAIKNENENSKLVWRISKCEAIIGLADVWGIELPGLEISRVVLPELETRYTNQLNETIEINTNYK